MFNLIKSKLILKYFSTASQNPKCNIGFLVLWVGTKCSLRCRDCGDLMPYSDQESFDINQIISDIKKVLTFCKITKLQIQGGEPFTHPNINKLITAINTFDIPEIVITTNGTVNLNQNIINLLKKIKNKNFKIVISSYNCVKERQNKFHNILIANKIECLKYNFFKNDYTWVNQGGVDTPKNKDDKNVQNLYSNCEFKVCLSLVDGKIYRCGRAPISYKVFKLKNNPDDSINIRNFIKTEDGYLKMIKFLNNNHFKEYCRYCLGTEEKIPPAIQLSTDIIR